MGRILTLPVTESKQRTAKSIPAYPVLSRSLSKSKDFCSTKPVLLLPFHFTQRVMQKILTKEQLAAKLNGRNYLDEISLEECEQAHDSGLVVVLGYSDDIVNLHGAIHDEVDAYDGGRIELTRSGVFQSECKDGTDCPYFKQLCRKQSVNLLKVFWCGKCKDETCPDWESKGKPTWSFLLDGIDVAEFSIFDPREDGEYFCRGIVFNVNDLKPSILEEAQ